MNEAFQFGIQLECISRGIDPSDFHKYAAVAEVMASKEAAPAKRLLLKAAHDLMVLCGDGTKAAAFHLQQVIELPGWSTHADDVYNTVVQACAANDCLEKHAFNDTVEGLGHVAKGLGYAGVLGGAGMGSLYWLLSRHATQDEKDNEARKQQLNYYNQLNRELQDSLARKYRYNAV